MPSSIPLLKEGCFFRKGFNALDDRPLEERWSSDSLMTDDTVKYMVIIASNALTLL